MHFISADLLFDGYSFLPNKSILVVENDGIIQDILLDQSLDNVRHLNGLVMPGLINAHCHLELSHLKSQIEEHTGLVDFLLAINSKRHNFTHNEILCSIDAAEKEMLDAGIVAVGDICNNESTFLQKQKRNLHYHSFIECFGLLDSQANERFLSAKLLYDEFIKLHNASIVLHAPYSISDTLITLVNAVSEKKISTIHNQESSSENELFINGNGEFLNLFKAILNDSGFFKASGKTSLQTYLPKLHHEEKLILVHNTFSSKEDIQFAQSLNKQLSWCLCPNANLYIENTLPDISIMMQENCHIVLGTDSLASNHQLSILHEIHTLQKYLPSISLEEKLKWATSNGALALGIDKQFGSFEKGKKPGIIQIENCISKTALPADFTPKRIY